VIAAGPHRAGGHKEAHVQGWLISVLLHGTVALAAIITVRQVQLTPQDDAFKWNVAMVSPAQSVQSTAPSLNQAPAQLSQSTTSTPSPPVRQSTPTQKLSSPQPVAPQSTPSISERTATTALTESPSPTPTQPTTPSPSGAHTTQRTEPIRNETVAPIASDAESDVRPNETSMVTSTSTDAEMESSSEPSTTPGQIAQSDQATLPAHMATISPAPSHTATKRDYGWLSETIVRRVEELKRYPASARVDRAEGKVVVKAVINEDGSIGEVNVFQSSGYPTLDEAAVETMQRAAPFHLPHPLGQPRMTIKIPMSYRLGQ
jgi:protein TonB